jgi:hypothetical protein
VRPCDSDGKTNKLPSQSPSVSSSGGARKTQKGRLRTEPRERVAPLVYQIPNKGGRRRRGELGDVGLGTLGLCSDVLQVV